MDVNFVDVCFLSNSGFFNEIITTIDQEYYWFYVVWLLWSLSSHDRDRNKKINVKKVIG